jgi:hypothetical protein
MGIKGRISSTLNFDFAMDGLVVLMGVAFVTNM